MSINSISPETYWLSQIGQQNGASQADSSAAAANAGATPAHVNGFFLALTQALSQVGVTVNSDGSTTANGSSGTTIQTGAAASSSSSSDPAQALATFMQSLMAALHAENSQSSPAGQGGTDSDGDNDGSPAAGIHGHGRHHGRLQADLQSLIQQLSATTDSSSSGTTASSSSGKPDSSLSSLQQSFQDLTSVFGGGGTTATLQGFLQAFNNNLQNTSLDGNVVNARA